MGLRSCRWKRQRRELSFSGGRPENFARRGGLLAAASRACGSDGGEDTFVDFVFLLHDSLHRRASHLRENGLTQVGLMEWQATTYESEISIYSCSGD